MILIVIAMESEAKEIVSLKHPDVDVLVTGIGKVNAAMKLAAYLEKHSVDLIINLGFVGGNGFELNDIVVIENATYHDFDLSIFGYQKGQVPHYPAIFETDKTLFNKLYKTLDKAKKGRLLTGDRFMMETVNTPTVFDMEGAAYYQVAHTYQIPIVSVKLVSDVIGEDQHLETYQTFEQTVGAHQLKEIFLKMMEVLL
ncbi:MAG: 5'-methylthioadenosine/S-adenosylhomocysteine nucleosidase [Acholeplasmataceae bacterium]|nr:5'-methylthioadenosine/S-adenosylhomocysteine nucleosidase [Acholeplasmataceae bacterium]